MEGKVKAAKYKVYSPPAGTGGLDGKFHVYTFDVFHQTFLDAHRAHDTIERAVQYQRSEQERIYTVQEAEPELFDLPFVSTDPDLVARAARDAEYRERLAKELSADARQRVRRR